MNLVRRAAAALAGCGWRGRVALLILALQVAGLVRARFVTDRYFCWAPHDQQTQYHVRARVDGKELAPRQIMDRYGLMANGWDVHCWYHLIDLIETRERRERGRRAEVELTFRVNGGPEQRWTYP